MGSLNELVIVLSAPLLVVFILLTADVRRFGAIHWVVSYLASWIAGFIDGLGPELQPLVVSLGSLSAVLFATGAHAYGGGQVTIRQWLGALLLPLGLGIVTAGFGTAWGLRRDGYDRCRRDQFCGVADLAAG